MNPSTNNKQRLIFLLLLLILVSIAAGYIYYGMNLAQRNNPADQMSIEATNVNVSPEEARRQQIIQDLSKPAPTEISESDRNLQLNILEAETTVNEMDPQDRAKILEDLARP